MSTIEAITSGKFFSGEMFDLTATSFNNDYGEAHNIAVMTYGINLPITKFKEELQKIATTTSDDKSDKRAVRLYFLTSCEGCLEVTILFTLYCNYLNGGGSGSTPENWIADQYKSFMVITAAGGNIIILFAQLIVNMIDSFIKIINTRNDGGDIDWKWNIKSTDPVYNPETFLPETEGLTYFTYANSMFAIPIDTLRTSEEFNVIIRKTFALLTPTNQLLLSALANVREIREVRQNTNEELCYIIVKYFIQATIGNPETINILNSVAQSNISDFDFKLSPNIHPSLRGDLTYGPITDTFTRLGLTTKDPGHAGFLLLRVKTLIDCGGDYIPAYSTRELKDFQRNCDSFPELGQKVWSLFPQIMQESYLESVPPDSGCWQYLNYLWQKKQAISLATRFNIDETMKFHMAGYYKQSNPEGDMFPLVPSAENSTEAIIHYIANTTYNLNIYVEAWEAYKIITNDLGEQEHEYKLGPSGAPALNHRSYGGLPQHFSYESVCSNFKSLSTILYEDRGLVTRLASDILNYFLNSPYFNTEIILDNLLKSFKEKKRELTGEESNAKMNPSSLILAPTHKDFNASLNNIKDIFRDSQYSALGYPDGIRITINAIVSTNETGDTQLDNVESVALQATTGPEIESALIYLEQKQKPEELQGGIVKTPELVKIGVQKLKKTKKVKKVKKVKKAKKTKKAKKAKKTKKAKKAKKTKKAKKSKIRFIKK